MNIILAEETRYPIGSFLDKIKDKFPESSRMNVSSSNLEKILKEVKTPPILTEGWLLLINVRGIESSMLKSLEQESNLCVYVVRSREEAEELSYKFSKEGLDYKFINNLSPSKSEIELYVREELGIDQETALYLCRRCRYFPSKVFESVDILRTVENITKSAIQKYTVRYNSISFDSLFFYILGSDSSVKKSQVVRKIEEYRYGIDFVFKYVLKRFDLTIWVFGEMLDGALSLENYKDFYAENKTDLRNCSEYVFRRIVESFEVVSYEKVYYLREVYRNQYEKDASIGGFLSILRLS